MWGDEGDGGPQPGNRAKVWVVLAVAVLLLLTLVLCCMATGQLGELFQLELPPL
jgi:hypothetical protein